MPRSFEPIIPSLLDLDFYKLTMGQLVRYHYPDVPVRYAFKCRTKGVNLAGAIAEEDLRRELDHVRTLRLTDTEAKWLAERRGKSGYRIFAGDYIAFLKNLELPPYTLRYEGENIVLEFEGKWSEAIYWETISLAILNELYYRATVVDQGEARFEGGVRLDEKLNVLELHPEISFSEFGTRRRFSRSWQDYVVRTAAKRLPKTQFLGTSNAHLAMKYGLEPIGTWAHELPMVMSGIMHGSDEEIRASHNRVLQLWWEMYGEDLAIALTDTYGTDFFFEDMTREQAQAWKGLRQDSGDPEEFGERAIRFYEGHGIDPREKIIVFSDGLDLETMLRLSKRFAGRIKVSFGWGTNLTNDLGPKALSLVVKAIEAFGNGLVKLSDNIAKAMGRPEDVERFKRIFVYTRSTFKECQY